MPSKAAASTTAPGAGGPRAIDFALQGGGAHGAFTWGVLDRLLEDHSLAIDGVSGTSAGAVNAAVMATGWAEGGRAGARQALRAFWHDVADSGPCFGRYFDGYPERWTGVPAAATPPWLSPWMAPWLAAWPWAPAGNDIGRHNLDGQPGFFWFSQMLRSFSPAQLNPMGLDPLADTLARHVRPESIRRGPLKLFIVATAVRTGRPRVFRTHEVDVRSVLASACLPQLFKPVLIDGEPYWDGGYSGNPALWPLIYETEPLDLVLVRINPLRRPGTPETAADINDRVNEITFSTALLGELRAIAFVGRLIDEGRLDVGRYRQLRLHMVADDDGLAPLHPSSKLNTDRRFLDELFEVGRAAGERWWQAHRADLGVRGTMDVQGFLDLPPAGAGA